MQGMETEQGQTVLQIERWDQAEFYKSGLSLKFVCIPIQLAYY